MRMKQGYVAALVAPSAAAIAHAGPSGGSINGKVTYQGTPETPKPIDTSREPIYAKQHATPMTETVVTNALENVLVYVPAGSLDETMPASQPVRIDQKPAHPSGGFSGQQSLEIANDDKTSHNIHPLRRSNASGTSRSPRDLR
jgi:hypothetical protein